MGWGDMDWIDLAQDKDRWRALAKWGNEPSGSIQSGEFLDLLRNGQLSKEDSFPWSK